PLRVVVLDDEHRRRSRLGQLEERRLRPRVGLHADPRHAREDGEERAALSGRALDADAAVLRLDDPSREGEAEPGSLVLLGRARVELLELDEEPTHVLGLDSYARILDFEAERILALGPDADR